MHINMIYMNGYIIRYSENQIMFLVIQMQLKGVSHKLVFAKFILNTVSLLDYLKSAFASNIQKPYNWRTSNIILVKYTTKTDG